MPNTQFANRWVLFIMTISDENRERKIQFIKIGSEEAVYPSIQVDLEIKTESIQGKFSSIWFDHTSIDGFANELAHLDLSRNGEAKLESVTPNECVLIIKNIDTLGHLRLKLMVRSSKGFKLDRQINYNDVEIGFEIDPTSLGQIQAQLKKIK